MRWDRGILLLHPAKIGAGSTNFVLGPTGCQGGNGVGAAFDQDPSEEFAHIQGGLAGGLAGFDQDLAQFDEL